MIAQRRIAWSVAAVAVLLVAAIVWLWTPDLPLSDLQARWAPAPSVFIPIDGMQVHARDEGPRSDPTPVLLLHGTAASLHTWEGWAQALKGQHRVIRIDLPGFGLTGPFPDGEPSLPKYMHVLSALLDHLGIRRCIVGGNSFGGGLAWNFAVDQPQRVAKLILVDAAGYDVNLNSNPGFRFARTPVLNKLVEAILPRRAVERSTRNVYGHPDRVTPELVERYYELMLRPGNRHALLVHFQRAVVAGRSDRIPEVKVPTLILWGGKDGLIPPVAAERFRRDIAGSQVVMFDDLGHVPHEEDPERTVAAVQRFLEAPAR